MRNEAVRLGLIFALVLAACGDDHDGDFPSVLFPPGMTMAGTGTIPPFDAGSLAGQGGLGAQSGSLAMPAGAGGVGPIEEPGVCPLEVPLDGETCTGRRLRCAYGVVECNCRAERWRCLESVADLDAGMDDMDAGSDDDSGTL